MIYAISDKCARSGCGHARGSHTGIAGACIIRADGCRCLWFEEKAAESEPDFYLEALREVDALTPSVPPLAPLYKSVATYASTYRFISAADAKEVVRRISNAGLSADGCPKEVHDDGKCLRGLAVER